MLVKCTVFLLKIYQNTIGLIMPRVCRYEPTCSTYAIQALTRHGIMKGGFLSVMRILRCNPLFPGGFDPVPECKRESRQ